MRNQNKIQMLKDNGFLRGDKCFICYKLVKNLKPKNINEKGNKESPKKMLLKLDG